MVQRWSCGVGRCRKDMAIAIVVGEIYRGSMAIWTGGALYIPDFRFDHDHERGGGMRPSPNVEPESDISF